MQTLGQRGQSRDVTLREYPLFDVRHVPEDQERFAMILAWRRRLFLDARPNPVGHLVRVFDCGALRSARRNGGSVASNHDVRHDSALSR